MDVKLVVSPTARPATPDDICRAFFGKNVNNLVKEIQLKGIDGVKERLASGTKTEGSGTYESKNTKINT